jgi:hypothetical protein
MAETTSEDETAAYHLLLAPPEAEIVARALALLISDEAHEPAIRGHARAVIELLDPGAPGADGARPAPSARPGTLSLPLTPPQLKIVNTAVHLLLLDTQRGQETERRLLHAVIEKLPDEHTIRSISIG